MTAKTLAAEARKRARLRIWRRDARLQGLGYPSYETYIASPTWVAIRARYRNSGREQDCVLCDKSERIILHHVTYERVGNEALDDLIPLCPKCHNYVHDLEASGYIESLDPAAIERIRDSRRALESRTLASKQKADRAGDYELLVSQEHESRMRSSVNRVKDACRRAWKEGVDTEGFVRRLNVVTEDFQKEISQKKDA